MAMRANLQAMSQGGALQRSKLQTIAEKRKKAEEELKANEFNVGNAIVDAAAAWAMSGGNPLVALGAAAFAPKGEFDPVRSLQQGATLGTGIGALTQKGGGDILKGATDFQNMPTITAPTLQALDPDKAMEAAYKMKLPETTKQGQQKMKTLSTDLKSNYLQVIGETKPTDQKGLTQIRDKIKIDTNLQATDKSALQQYINSYQKEPEKAKRNVYGEYQNEINTLQTMVVDQMENELKPILIDKNIPVKQRKQTLDKFTDSYITQIKSRIKSINTDPDLKSSDLQIIQKQLEDIMKTLENSKRSADIPERGFLDKFRR